MPQGCLDGSFHFWRETPLRHGLNSDAPPGTSCSVSRHGGLKLTAFVDTEDLIWPASVGTHAQDHGVVNGGPLPARYRVGQTTTSQRTSARVGFVLAILPLHRSSIPAVDASPRLWGRVEYM